MTLSSATTDATRTLRVRSVTRKHEAAAAGRPAQRLKPAVLVLSIAALGQNPKQQPNGAK